MKIFEHFTAPSPLALAPLMLPLGCGDVPRMTELLGNDKKLDATESAWYAQRRDDKKAGMEAFIENQNLEERVWVPHVDGNGTRFQLNHGLMRADIYCPNSKARNDYAGIIIQDRTGVMYHAESTPYFTFGSLFYGDINLDNLLTLPWIDYLSSESPIRGLYEMHCGTLPPPELAIDEAVKQQIDLTNNRNDTENKVGGTLAIIAALTMGLAALIKGYEGRFTI